MQLPFKAPTLTATISTGGSTPASNSPWSTPTWAAPRAPPPPSTHVRRAGPNTVIPLSPPGRGSGRRAWLPLPSRPLFPGRKVALLLRGQGVDRDPHRVQLELRDLLVDLVGHVIHPLLERGCVGRDVRGAKSLVGEAHVHDGGRVPFRGGKVDQPSLREHVQPATVSHLVLLNGRPHLAHAGGHLVQRLEVDLGVEMA